MANALIRRAKLAVVLLFTLVGVAMAVLHWAGAFDEPAHVPAVVSDSQAVPIPEDALPREPSTDEAATPLPADFYGLPDADSVQ